MGSLAGGGVLGGGVAPGAGALGASLPCERKALVSERKAASPVAPRAQFKFHFRHKKYVTSEKVKKR